MLLIAWDDVGYGTMDCFGGPVKTPTMSRIAEMGVRYSNFHTTALCSPTRASLMTGRNATSNGMATIAEFSAAFPGISTRIPFENGFFAEVVAQRGYNTYCVGKWHLTPGEETSVAAYKGRWPLGRGFERFYGFLGGESSCWYPDLIHDNHPVDPPRRPSRDITLSAPGRQTQFYAMLGQRASGTLTLQVDEQVVGVGDIVTQPGLFCAVGDGICVGRDDASAVTPDYRPPFRFTGGTIEKVVVDVSGTRYVDHEAQVRGWFMID